MKSILMFVLLGLAAFAPDVKALTCYNVYSVYDYYTNGVYTHTGIESSGINCYEDGTPNGDGGPYEDEGGPVDPLEDPEEPPICAVMRESEPNGCNIYNPPPAVIDGCTLVPNFLVVNGTPASSLGDIFVGACNQHDRCYSLAGANKQTCDLKLEQDMIEIAQVMIPSIQWSYYEPHVRLQAAAYSAGFYNNVLWIPQSFFNSSQVGAACRAHVSAMHEAGCLVSDIFG